MKNFSVLATLLGLLIGSGNALAHSNHNHANKYRNQYNNQYDHSRYFARIVNIRPVYRYSQQRNRYGCSSSYSSNHNHTGTVIGGIVGGVIGNELGRGGHRRGHRHAATAAGVIVGAAVGNAYDHRNTSRRNCGSYSNSSRRLSGYELAYSYRGKVRHTFVTRKPPRRFRIEQLRRYQ